MKITAEYALAERQIGAGVVVGALGKRLDLSLGLRTTRDEAGVTVDGKGGVIGYGHIKSYPISPRRLPLQRLNNDNAMIGQILCKSGGVASRIEMGSGSARYRPTIVGINSEPFGPGSYVRVKVSGDVAEVYTVASRSVRLDTRDRNTGRLIIHLPQ